MKTLCSFAVLMFVSILCGCNSERENAVAMRRACITQLGKSYQEFVAEKKASPTGSDELAEFMQANAGDDMTISETVKRMRDGDILVHWNGDMSVAGKENYVLAFEGPCPRGGGYVVMASGELKLVSAAQYAKTKEIPKLSK